MDQSKIYKSTETTHMTSGLVNRKYKAAVEAPVAANAMSPTRGISCNAHVFKHLVIKAVFIQPILFKSMSNVKIKQKQINNDENNKTPHLLLLRQHLEKSSHLFKNIKKPWKTSIGCLRSTGLKLSSWGWRERVWDAAARGRFSPVESSKDLQVSGSNIR